MTSIYEETTLDNGLRIVAQCTATAASSAIGFFVKTGARDETSELMGVSHFLEHMMFKGTDSMSAEEVDVAFDELGAEHNAFTSGEMTAFWGASMPDVIGDVHDVLANILRPALRQEDFDSEKDVILEEIAMYADQPFWVLYERALETYYEGHPLGHRVLGTNETIEVMQRDALEQYFRHRYAADNTIVALAGNINFKDMVTRIEASCGSWERTGVTRTYGDIPRASGSLKEAIPNLNQHYLMMMMPSTEFDDERKFAATAIAAILGGDVGSRFHWALVDKGLADEASASVNINDGYGEQLVWATCTPKNAEQVATVMREEMSLVSATLTQGDLDKVKAKAATEVAIQNEHPSGSMQRLGAMLTTSGTYISLAQQLEKIESLTIQDLQDVVQAFPWTPLFEASTTHE